METTENSLPSLVSEADLLRAYRKAKVDVHYERDQELAYEFCRFECDLVKNLSELRERVIARNWSEDITFLGKSRYSPKSIDPRPDAQSKDGNSIYTGRKNRWGVSTLGEKPSIKFREHSHCTVFIHVLSAFWIARIGERFDALLSTDCYGNRVRRIHPRDEASGDDDQAEAPYHEYGLGSFESYLPGYRRWRDVGLRTIQENLDAKKPIVAITADLASFYHEIDVRFMIAPSFLDLLGDASLNRAEYTFHQDFITALHTWSKAHGGAGRGLPVGLGVSRVIANCILIEFDRSMSRRVKPLYYGRYVDDVFIVLSDGEGLKTLSDVWNEIGFHLNRDHEGMLSVGHDEEGDLSIQLSPSYASSAPSKLIFRGQKQKAFFLDAVGGPTLLASIKNHIRESSSIWRRLPELAESEELADLCFLSHGSSPSENPDVLRKADAVSIRRSRFAMRLRDLEAICEDIPAPQWQAQRRAFVTTVCREIAETHELFNFSTYLPRVFALAVASGDLPLAKKLVVSIKRGFDEVYRLLHKELVNEKPLAQWSDSRRKSGEQLLSAAAKAWPHKVEKPEKWEDFTNKIASDFGAERPDWSFYPAATGIAKNSLAHAHACLFAHDLATRPFRSRLLEELNSDILLAAPALAPVHAATGWWGANPDATKASLLQFLRKCWGFEAGWIPRPLVFPTRPFSFSELTLLACARTADGIKGSKLGSWLQTLRGTFGNPDDDFGFIPQPGASGEAHYPTDEADRAEGGSGKVRIVLTCFLTETSSFRASVLQLPDPTADRYRRATSLINSILASGRRVDYIIFPELSLREHWFNRFAMKLAKSRISLIAGLDYQKGSRWPATKHLINQTRCSLVTNAPGYPAAAYYVQNKQEPALIERNELRNINNASLCDGGLTQRYVVVHGAWRFGVLICNELTDLAARTVLRGKVDGLIVPEWNRDVNSFSALVEATALDLPAYIIQINNRSYGDSRVRQPHQDPWLRDLTQVKGGELDYFTVVTLDINALRYFQSQAISPERPYKPVPTGFVIDEPRRRAHP